MRPYKDINVGDIYCRGGAFTLEWAVLEKDEDEKMVLITPMYQWPRAKLNPKIWEKNTNAIFRNRVFKGTNPGGGV